MELTSLKIKYADLNKSKGGVLVYEGRFWKIISINDSEFIAKSDKDELYGYNKFLQPYGKTGTIKQYDGDKPFFKYSLGNLRRDTPLEVKEGTLYNKIETSTIKGLKESNLTGSVVQIGYKSKEGGFVIHDTGSEVVVSLKSGKEKRFDKSYLHYNKIHYTKKSYKRLWFVYDSTKLLNNDTIKITSKGNKVVDYLELESTFDKDYLMSTDFRTYNAQSTIQKQLTGLWGQMTPSERLKVTKKKR